MVHHTLNVCFSVSFWIFKLLSSLCESPCISLKCSLIWKLMSKISRSLAAISFVFEVNFHYTILLTHAFVHQLNIAFYVLQIFCLYSFSFILWSQALNKWRLHHSSLLYLNSLFLFLFNITIIAWGNVTIACTWWLIRCLVFKVYFD